MTKMEYHIPIQFLEQTSTATSYTDVAVSIVKIDTSKFVSPTFYFEASFKSGGSTAYVALFDNSTNDTITGSPTQVSNSEVSDNTGSVVRKRSSAITLTDGNRYIVRVKNASSATLTLEGAKIIVVDDITGGWSKAHQQCGLAMTGSNATSTYQECYYFTRFYYDSSLFDGTTKAVYLEVNLHASSKTAYAELYDLTSSTQIVELSTSATTSTRLRSADIFSSLTNGHTYTVRIKNYSTKTTYLQSARLIIEQTTSITKTQTRIPFQTMRESTNSTSFVEIPSTKYINITTSNYPSTPVCYFEVLGILGGAFTGSAEIYGISSSVATITDYSVVQRAVSSSSFTATDSTDLYVEFKISNSSTNFYHYATQLLLNITASSTTQRQITKNSDARIKSLAKQITKNSNGRIKVLAKQTTKNSDARIRVLAKTVTKNSNARIKKLAIQVTKNSNARIFKSGTQITKTSDAKVIRSGIQITKNSNARVKVLAKQITKNSDARIKKASIQITKNSDARVKVLAKQITKTSDARIKVVKQTTKNSDARVKHLAYQTTKTSDARIKVTGKQLTKNSNARIYHKGYSVTKNSDARVKVLAKQTTKTSDAKIVRAGVQITKTSDARVKVLGKQITKTSDAKIVYGTRTITKNSDARIKKLANQITKTSDAKISSHVQITKTSDARIFKPANQITKTSDARIKNAAKQATKTSDARIKKLANQITKTADSRIKVLGKQITKTSDSRVKHLAYQSTKTSDARIKKLAIQITKDSSARIRAVNKQITKNADARIMKTGIITKTSNAKVILDPNIVARYDMQTTIETTKLKDLSGFGNTGEPNGGVTVGGTTGIYQNATQFDGTDDFFSLGQDSSITNITTNKLSLVAWVYITSYSTNYTPIICSSDSNDSVYGMFVKDDGRVEIKLKLSGTVYTKTFGAAGAVTLDTWHQLVFTFDGSNWEVYIDKTKQTTQTQSGTLDVETHAIVLGRYSP